jgi:hypothetical protein
MTTKINYSSQKVSVSAELSFSEMGALQDALAIAALEAIDRDEDKTLDDILTAAEKFGIDLDLDLEVKHDEVEALTKVIIRDSSLEPGQYTVKETIDDESIEVVRSDWEGSPIPSTIEPTDSEDEAEKEELPSPPNMTPPPLPEDEDEEPLPF